MTWLSKFRRPPSPPEGLGPVLLFSYGITRSGSTLAYLMAHFALELAGCRQPSLPGHRGRVNFVPRLDQVRIDMLSSIANDINAPLVVKLHNGPKGPATELLRTGRAKAHVIVRDPRDIALSLIDRGKAARKNNMKAFSEVHNLADAKASIDNQMPKLLRWLKQPGILRLDYSELVFNGDRSIQRILDHIGIAGNVGRIHRAIRKSGRAKPVTAQQDRYRAAMSDENQAWFEAAYKPFYDHVMPAERTNFDDIDDLKSPRCASMITPPSLRKT